jgi:hypothetical protein
MSTSHDAAADRAREFIDDVLKINAEHGMGSVTSEGAYDSAVARAARACEQISRFTPASQR